ncbi:MAG: tRNA adenosine deaminase-associated protein [Actinocatenispora sp.]
MSYFAAAVTRGPKGWAVAELDLGRPSEMTDVEEVAELLRDTDIEAEVSLLFVEVDDEYLAILRLDEGEDLRVFGSDAAFVDESPVGAMLLGEEDRPGSIDLPDDDFDPSDEDGDGDDADDDDDEAVAGPDADDAEPIGDVDLLADLGMPGRQLRALCIKEGMLPSDMTAEICGVLGCAEDVEELR